MSAIIRISVTEDIFAFDMRIHSEKVEMVNIWLNTTGHIFSICGLRDKSKIPRGGIPASFKTALV